MKYFLKRAFSADPLRRFLTGPGVACLLSAGAGAEPATIQVDVSKALHPVSPYLTGACLEDVNHEIYGGLYSQMIFGESFQEPAPTPPVAGFLAYDGRWTAENGELNGAAGAGPKLIYDATNGAAGEVSADVLFTGNDGGNAGLILNVSHAGTGADTFTGYEISLSPDGHLILGRHVQDWEPISETACAVPIGQWLALRVAFTNAALQVSVNGQPIANYTDTTHPLIGGQVGLRTWQRHAKFRNFTITSEGVTRKIHFSTETNFAGSGVSGMWNGRQHGTARGRFSLETDNPFAGAQYQRLTFAEGTGEVGLANRGLNRWGMYFAGGHPYEGCLWARAKSPAPLCVTLESSDGSLVLAEQKLTVTSNHWQRLDFTLTPNATNFDGCFAIKLKVPGSVDVGYAFLQPGTWGRFKNLPVRRDVAEGLINQGITVLRYGGSMVNADGYRWKNMVGPRDRRPPYHGTWYPYSSDGWGILDFLDFCEAAGFAAVPDLNVGERPEDIAHFIDYVNGATNTVWGARRAADGHSAPYRLKYIELGNEERVDENYFAKFKPLVETIWAKDTNLIIVAGDFAYSEVITNPAHFGGAASGITSLATQAEMLALAKEHDRQMWFDVHVLTDGPRPDSSLAAMFSYYDALDRLAHGARHRVVVFELNANNPTQRRALANALAINAIERDGRLPITTSANCLQPDGQNDNGWDQGLLFLNPSQVWLEPPGYVTQMKAASYLPLAVNCTVTGNTNLDVSAKASDDRRTVVLQVVNADANPVMTAIQFQGFAPANPIVEIEQLAGPLAAVNTAAKPTQLAPVRTQWRPDGGNYNFPPYSFTVLTFK